MNQDPREFLIRINEDISQRFLIVGSFLSLMLLLRVIFEIPLHDSLFILVSLISLISLPVAILFTRIKEKNPFLAVNSYLGYVMTEVIILSIIINLIGGITWIGFSFYLFYTVSVFWIFPRPHALFLTAWIIFISLILVSGTYLKIFPYFDLFPIEKKTAGSFAFVFTSAIVSLTVLSFVAYTSDSFYRILARTIEELRKKTDELSLSRQFLRKEIEERTKELQEEKRKITHEIEEKTRELTEKKGVVDLEVKKLEVFYQKAVSRELELMAIKEKITQLKGLKHKK